MVEDGNRPQLGIQILSRAELAILSPQTPEQVSTPEAAMTELLRGLSGIPEVAGIGVFEYERRSHIRMFLACPSSDEAFWRAGQEGNKVSYAFDVALRRFGRGMASSYTLLEGKSFEEAAIYFSVDHSEMYPTRDQVAKVEKGELSEGISGESAIGILFQDAFNFGNLKGTPRFVKFE